MLLWMHTCIAGCDGGLVGVADTVEQYLHCIQSTYDMSYTCNHSCGESLFLMPMYCIVDEVGSRLTSIGTLQVATTSKAATGPCTPHGAHVRTSMSRNAPSEPGSPQGKQPTNPQFIALKDGDAIPDGYRYVVREVAVAVTGTPIQMQSACATVNLCTPPKTAQPSAGDIMDSAKKRTTAKRNLTRNMNRKANTTFARELKESLANGQPTTMTVAKERSDLKATWHAAAKEVAYKFLDLRREGWKEYSLFEKDRVHIEINELCKFDPPLDPKKVDKYLSAHFRTARAVWKAHWKKHGDTQRHHNCPPEAWAKLTKWWPTEKCQEEAADMANRRSKVESNSKIGRNSLVDRMDVVVSVIFLCVYEDLD